LLQKIVDLGHGAGDTLGHHAGDGWFELSRRTTREMTQAVSGAPNVATGDIRVTGRRILATVVDGLLFGLAYTVMALLFGTTVAEGGHVSATLPALPSVLYGVRVVLYYILLEGYVGQTVGKMLLGIKVVREDNGKVPGVGGATVRTLLRLIDGLFSYVVAFIAVLVSAKNQRLGDMAAHTLVVRK
jgi:uncharacterized RDD family membrane protein YckC